MPEITNGDDTISAADLRERIAYLTRLTDGKDQGEAEDEYAELDTLTAFADAAEGQAGNWADATLIRDGFTAQYAEETAESIHGILLERAARAHRVSRDRR